MTTNFKTRVLVFRNKLLTVHYRNKSRLNNTGDNIPGSKLKNHNSYEEGGFTNNSRGSMKNRSKSRVEKYCTHLKEQMEQNSIWLALNPPVKYQAQRRLGLLIIYLVVIR